MTVQAKLTVGPADDPLEREADLLADRIMGTLASTAPESAVTGRATRVARHTPDAVQRAEVGAAGGDISRGLASRITAARGGDPIEPALRSRIEAGVGADLSGVRVHAGSDLPRRMAADAFTVGNRIHFAPGLYDPSSRAGQHLIAHEVAHTLQQGAAPARRRTVVQRKLIPKALDAFNAAEAANTKFGTGRKDTDDLAAESDQEDLARVHGRGYRGGDSDDQKRVAHYVRAVVLTEYSARLRALETATNRDGSALTGKQKAGKKAVYKKKADEFRQKHTPLVEKGARAPETKMFLKEHGFDVGFAPPKPTEKKGSARIDVRATFIGAEILGMRLRSHLFIVYTAEDGRQLYFRGGPGEDDNTEADLGDYAPGTIDWDPSAPTVTVLEGPAAKAKLDALIEATKIINGMKVPYQGVIAKGYGGANPNKLQELGNYVNMGLSSEGENCNATAWTILTRAGVPTKKPSGHHPGWGSILGSKTAGKENALPAAETDAPPVSYIVDDTRDVATNHGIVQMYADRTLFEPTMKIGVGTKVSMLDENTRYRKIRYGGEVGYIPVKTEDAVYMLSPQWTVLIEQTYTDVEVQQIAAQLDDQAQLDAVEQDTGIPADYVATIVRMVATEGGRGMGIIQYRLDQLGPARLRDMLKGDEIARLATMFKIDPKSIVDAVTDAIEGREKVAKVPVVLMKHRNDPNAANLVLNEAPDYPTLEAIIAELGEDPTWVVEQIESLRPKANQGKLFEQLLASDPIAESELPNVAGYMLTAWATQTGVPVDFLKARCVEVHKAREAKRAAEAAAAKAAKEKAEQEAAEKAKAKKAKPKKAKAQKKKPPPKKPVAAKPRVVIDPDLEKTVGMALIVKGIEDAKMWLEVNDLPKLTLMNDVAGDTGASVEQVIDVTIRYFPPPSGAIRLHEALAQLPAADFAHLTGNTVDSRFVALIQKLAAQTGLDDDFIDDRIGEIDKQPK